jgi:RHS repeat-associated protein
LDGINVKEETVFVYSAGKLVAEYSTKPPPSNPTTSYTATDQLGSPRVITDSLGNVISRRDFMPFGEEIVNNIGERAATSLKYNVADSVRQKFTGYEKDDETNLDFAEARMYENRHGRFTAVDPLLASGKSANPQSFNRYVYCQNRPLVLTDPTGQFGDYYNRQGQYIGSDDKNDGKKYYADVTRREGDTAWVNNIVETSARPNRTAINSLSGSFTQSVSNTATAFGGTAYNALAGFDNLVYGGLDRLNFEYIATGRPGNNFPRIGYWEPKNEEQEFASTVYTGASFFIPFGEASMAAEAPSFARTATTRSSVLLDSNVIPPLSKNPSLGGLIAEGETPLVSYVTRPELRNAVSSGRGLRGVPKILNDLEVLTNQPSINLRINIRGQISSPRGNFGDGIIGAQAIENNMTLITSDQQLANAVQSFGGGVRYFKKQ